MNWQERVWDLSESYFEPSCPHREGQSSIQPLDNNILQIYDENNTGHNGRQDMGSLLSCGSILQAPEVSTITQNIENGYEHSDSLMAEPPSSREHSPKLLQKLKKNGQRQKNPSPSKNFFLFIWKKVMKYLKSQKRTRGKWLQKMIKQSKGSMENFNCLFKELDISQELETMFQSRILFRCLITSSIDPFLKKAYIPFLRKLKQAHKKGFIDHLK